MRRETLKPHSPLLIGIETARNHAVAIGKQNVPMGAGSLKLLVFPPDWGP